MPEQNFFEMPEEAVLQNENYQKWRAIHTKQFGPLFEDAFAQNKTAQISLTAALIHISQRAFKTAMPILDMLESICECEADEIAVYYFKGLNHEMLGNEADMAVYYEKLKSVERIPPFTLALHPYYRTAKFAQRDSECRKSLYYYRKALELYDGAKPAAHIATTASHIIYDIATLCLYMHEYAECERFLQFSRQYDSSQNQHRDYVTALLLAIQGKKEECLAILETLSPFLRENCLKILNGIWENSDPHYCVIPQNRSRYRSFWKELLHEEGELKELIASDLEKEAEKRIGEKLTKALPFVKRALDCRIEKTDGSIVVKCKNYRIKTLAAEHAALFAMQPESLTSWSFHSVEEFESF